MAILAIKVIQLNETHYLVDLKCNIVTMEYFSLNLRNLGEKTEIELKKGEMRKKRKKRVFILRKKTKKREFFVSSRFFSEILNTNAESFPFDIAVGGLIVKTNENTTWSRFTFTPKWLKVIPKQELFLPVKHWRSTEIKQDENYERMHHELPGHGRIFQKFVGGGKQ